MTELRLVELSAATIVAVNTMSLKPGQEQYLAPTSYAVAGAVVNPTTAWQRVVLDGDEVVGFVSANFDPEAPQDHFRSVLWRINVDADDQGRGVGRFAVDGLLDEATASLDIPSERQIQEALQTLLADRTAIIIAHRLSTVAIADRVLVMEHGEIIEDDTPEALIAGTGKFARLHAAWRESLV